MSNSFYSRVLGQFAAMIPRRGEQLTIAGISLLALMVLALASVGGRGTIARLPGPPRFVIDPNAATEAELLLLPRVGPSLAKAILDERALRPFENARDVGRTRGIGEKTLVKLMPHLRVGEIDGLPVLPPSP